MTALGLTDTNRIRNAERVKCEPVLNTVPLIEIASATIASVPAYPGVVASVGVTGVTNWANVGVGRAFSIESAAGKIKSWGVVRLFPTSTTFYMDAKSDGDGGYARDTMEPFVAGDVIRVYWHRPDWALISRATGEAAFKAWDIAYDGSNSLPVPVCNIIYEPQHWAVAGKARVRLDASLSFDWLYSFAGIIAYQWSLPVGSTIVTGSASSAIVEADIPSGTHEIVCTVTSQTGRQSTGFRWLFINERDPASPHAPFNYKYAIESIRGDTSSRDGREMTFVLRGDVRADLYPGQPFVFTNRVYYDGQLLTDTTNRHFIGFLDEMGGDFSRRDKTTTFKVQGGLKITKALPSATQLMEETLAPNDWTQVAPSFMHSAFAAYYILRHHTTSLYNHNFGFNLNLLPLRRRNFGFSQETIGAQLGFIEDISLAEINATSDGFIYMLREPSHLVNQARDALPIRYTIKGTDLRDRISLEPRLRPQAAFVVMDGLAYNGQDIATYRAVAPGYAQGQGLSKSDDPDITVTVGGGQAELEFVVGDRFAYNNNPLDGLSLKLLGMIDIFDPALDDWLKLDIDEDYLQFRPDKFGVNWRGRDGTGIRARPVQVTRNWRKVGNVWVFDVNLTIRTETDGTRGAFLPVERGGAANYVTPPGVIETPPLLPPEPPEFPLSEEYALAFPWNELGEPGVSFNFLDEVVEWEDPRGDNTSSQYLVGQVIDGCWYNGAADPACYVVTKIDDDTVRVYSCPNLDASPRVWNQHLTVDVGPGWQGRARILHSQTAPRFLALIWSNTSGVFVRRANSSNVFGDLVKVGSVLTTITPEQATQQIGAEIIGNTLYVPGTGDVDQFKLFAATGQTGVFTAINNHPGDLGTSSDQLMCIKRADSNTLVTTYNLYDDTPISTTISAFGNNNRIVLATYPTNSSTSDARLRPTRYGIDYIERSTEQAQRIRYTVTRFKGTFVVKTMWPSSAAPGGTSTTPDYYPPTDVWRCNLTGRIVLVDQNRLPLYAQEIRFENISQAYTWSIDYFNANINFPFPLFVQFTCNAFIDVTLPVPIENVAGAEMYLTTNTPVVYGSWFQNDTTLPEFQVGGDMDFFVISNKVNTGRRLYKITLSTATWADITPDDEQIPTHHNGLTAAGSELRMIAVSDQGRRKFMRSGSGGTLWTTGRSTTYQWMKRLAEDTFIVGGQDKLDLSIDDLDTFEERIGQWNRDIGPVGRMDGALILVEQE